jgi:uncharacterized MAPEG superfamily protein
MSQITVACAPVAVFLAFFPHLIKNRLVTVTLDEQLANININPREALARAVVRDDPNAAIIQRASAAHNNQLEFLPIFLGSLLFAIMYGVPPKNIDAVALTYVALRALYIYLYLTGTVRWKASARSFTWCCCVGICTYLFIHAAIKAPTPRQLY